MCGIGSAQGRRSRFLATGVDLSGFEIGEVVVGSGIELQAITQAPKGFTHFN